MELEIRQNKEGMNYSVRNDRRRYFFPDEWNRFIKQFDPHKQKTQRFFFITLLHTGARSMEALHIKHKDIDVERGSITLRVVKQRGDKRAVTVFSKPRTFFVASNFIKEYKSLIRGKTPNPEHYIFLDNHSLPENYDNLENTQKKVYFKKKFVAYSQMLKRKLKKAGINDWYNFSPHNLRKTYGNWMRAFNIQMSELCYRMGHDLKTYMAFYGSALIFTQEERIKMMKIMGEVR